MAIESLKFLVKHEDAKSITDQLKLGMVLGQFVDGLYLIIKELPLQIIGQMGVIVARSDLVHIQQGLVHL